MTNELPKLDPMLWPPMSATIGKVSAAFVKAQAQLEHASKDSLNPHFKSKFADLPTSIDVYRPVFAAHDLALLQRELESSNGVRLQTITLHASGEWIADGGPFRPAVKNDAQSFGSALTYLRRQAGNALIGLAQDDDDGNAAANRGATATKPKKEPSVKLASIDDRDALLERIVALPEDLQAQIKSKLKDANIVWTQLTPEQLLTATSWTQDCEDIQDLEGQPRLV